MKIITKKKISVMIIMITVLTMMFGMNVYAASDLVYETGCSSIVLLSPDEPGGDLPGGNGNGGGNSGNNGGGSSGHHDDDDEDEHEHHHHHADDVFTSWGVESPKKFAEDELNGILEKLANTEEYGQVLRSKGIVPSDAGEWLHFDLTPGEYEVRKGSADYTGRICVIGAELLEDKLKELFGV